MKTSDVGFNLIKKYEGLRLHACVCPTGVLTIGYGHTGRVDGREIQKDMEITQAKAEELLREDLAVFEKGVSEAIHVPLYQAQFDALVSFSYNLGLGNLRGSKLRSLLNQKKYQAAAEQFPLWVNVGGHRLEELVRRRHEEKLLFLSALEFLAKSEGKSEVEQEEGKADGKKPANIIDNFTVKNWVKTLPNSIPKYIVIHSTGNTASAKNENANTVNNAHGGVGAHYSVDEKDIYHTLQDDRKIYHCGTAGYYQKKHPLCNNSNSVGIEMCQKDMKGTIAPETIENTSRLVQYLMQKYHIPQENVLRHFDVVSKLCPVAYAGTPDKEQKWKQLKKRLLGHV